jgi:hypothetical protein
VAEPAPEERGVHNPRVVDLISGAPADGAVELLMLERRPWGSDPLQLRQLEAKFNAYLGYVQLGYLVRDYPQYAERRVRFRLACAGEPAGEAVFLLDAMRGFAENEGIEFVVDGSATA